MKKILMVATVLASAAIAHGAAVSWSASGLGKVNSSDDLTSYAAYFIQDTTEAAVQSAISGGTFDSLTKSTGSITGSARAGFSVSGSATTTHTYSDGDYTSVLVLFNTDKSKYTLASATTSVGEATGSATFTFPSGVGKDAGNWADAPEPTTAGLMLLGLAALALKRKRA